MDLHLINVATYTKRPNWPPGIEFKNVTFTYPNAEQPVLRNISCQAQNADNERIELSGGLVEDKTAIYISHRMSSSVFCDKILIIDGGVVADFDTHENLMKKTESLYYKLFRSQAENYRIETV